LFARTGVALAATAPISLVMLAAIPHARPVDLVPFGLSILAAGLLVVGAELASFEQPPTNAPPAPTSVKRDSWTDPAMVSVERWLGHWPGLAGVTAMGWWAARAGAAGLLLQLAFHAADLRYAEPLAAAATACLVAITLLPIGRHLVHVALGAVAVIGVGISLSGLVAITQGRLTYPVLPAGPLWPTAGTAGAEIVEAATTVALLCLPCVALLAVAPASTAAGRARWATITATGATVCCWAFAVPMLLRASGISLARVSLEGAPGALTSTLGTVLSPVAGADAGTVARWALFVAGVAGATGALSGATTLAENAFRAAKMVGAGRHYGTALTGPLAGRLRPNGMPSRGLGAAAGLSVLGGAGAAAIGPTPWLLVALGSAAASALALTTTAPPVLKRYKLVPSVGRVGVAATWTVVVTVALGAAGPIALGLAGVGALVGAFAMAWGTLGGPIAHWHERRLVVPFEMVAAALVTATAVTTLELLATVVGAGSATTWRGLAVLVMSAGIVVMAVAPATSRLWTERLHRAAKAMAERALPTLAATVEALAEGRVQRVPLAELANLKAIARPLEADDAPPEQLRPLTEALVEAARQALRLAASIDLAAGAESRRLEELVQARTAALANANRNLTDSHWQRRQLLDRTVRAAEAERARLAANLHDGPIQRLATLGLVLDRCRLRLDKEDTAGAVALVKRARVDLAEEINRLRRLMSELRPPVLDEGGLDSALEDQLSSWSSATGMEADFETEPYGPLNADSETVVYRVVQEALANVAKHSKAGAARVSIGPSGNGVLVVVRDDGKGFDVRSQPELLRQGHYGLVVMRERVELASGRFDIKSKPLGGTEVSVWLPTATAGSAAGAAGTWPAAVSQLRARQVGARAATSPVAAWEPASSAIGASKGAGR
jgi:signal transduction histidine kinase